MNNIRLEHPGKPDEDGKYRMVVGGTGKAFINGQHVEGVLDITPNFMSRDEVASVTITLSVARFTYGPEESYVEYQPLEGDRTIRIPTVPMRD